MATGSEYTEEQLNYYRICCITTDELTDGLRTIFKQEWDNRYATTLGEWKDEAKNGQDFKNGESPRNQASNRELLATMINGNRAEWDCSMLFYAILYSDCIGRGLNVVVRSNIDDLRKFRYQDFAHLPRGQISEPKFQSAITKLQGVFQALGLSTVKIQEIRNQANFSISHLNKILKEVDKLKQEVKVLEEQLQRTVTSEALHLDLNEGAIHLTFPPDTVAEPTDIMVYKWKYGACLPQLTEHEAVVSNVIEISAAPEVGGLKFNSEVKLVLSHSAAGLEGYEVVLKRLIDKEKNQWEETAGCDDIRQV
ncbi:hypothetical protein P5673_026333, partial [Acropora cervicornis]